ncbi:MAG: hypothetical protein KKB94_08900, partial [Proteobacteria bacterium]|nr:hypothetical protein [Pseudomonadota bacterium]
HDSHGCGEQISRNQLYSSSQSGTVLFCIFLCMEEYARQVLYSEITVTSYITLQDKGQGVFHGYMP